MLSKLILDKVLKRLKGGGLTIHYWDGEVRSYGKNPYLTLRLKGPTTAWRILADPSLGIGKSYKNGQLEIEGDPGELLRIVADNKKQTIPKILQFLTGMRKPNIRRWQQRHVQHHYDIGNDFYRLWLDESMTYSCAYFRSKKDSLEQAQNQKIDHILRKLQLKRSLTLLDIGCGWGQLLIRAAKQYGISGLGITLSQEQFKLAKKRAKEAGVNKQLKFELINFQDLAKQNVKFDRIVSVGMFEHVGRRNQERYYNAIDKLLENDGLSLLHTISKQTEAPMDRFIDRYIFPGTYVPSVKQVTTHLAGHNLRLTDYENLRLHYAMTTAEWWRRFEKHKKIVIEQFDEQFYRMWRFYLACGSGSFRYGELDLSQFVFTKGLPNDLPLTRSYLYK